MVFIFKLYRNKKRKNHVNVGREVGVGGGYSTFRGVFQHSGGVNPLVFFSKLPKDVQESVIYILWIFTLFMLVFLTSNYVYTYEKCSIKC